MSIGKFFDFLRAARAPLLVSVFLSITLALPPQVIEIYRSIAQSLALGFADFGQRLRELAFSGAALALVSMIIWLAASSATSTRPRASGSLPGFFTHASLISALMAVLPVLAMSVGCLRAITQASTPDICSAARRALVDIVASGRSRPEPPPPQAVDATLSGVLNYNSYLKLGAAGCAVLSVVLVASFVCLARCFAAPERIGNARVRTLPPLLLCAGAILALCLMPASAAIQAGPIGTLCMFGSILAILLSCIALWSDKIGIPFGAFLIAYVAIVSVTGLNDSDRVFSLPANAGTEGDMPAPAPSVEDMFVRWYWARPDREAFAGRRYPVYLVAAEGGGIYAAYHTASSLGAIQDGCPAFARHTFAISGVSGGSVGAAVFASLANVRKPSAIPTSDSPMCELDDRPRREVKGEFSFVRASDRILSPDFLSPVVYGVLFPDFVQLFVPHSITTSDRARQFELMLERSLSTELVKEEQTQRVSAPAANLLGRPFITHWRPDGDTPALVLNTTEVGTDRRRIVSPFMFSGDDVEFLPVWQGDLRGMPLSTAAILSARFPWITPPGWYYENVSSASTWEPAAPRLPNQLVDGGYFENSGVASALDVIRAIKPSNGCRPRSTFT